MIAYAVIYLNMPRSASIHATDEAALIPTRLASRVGLYSFANCVSIPFLFSLILALLCSFLLGLGDSCFNTQIYSLIGSVYKEDSSPAFAIFKFIQSLATSMAFFYSNYIGLDMHVYILAASATIGTLAFFAVERISRLEKAGSSSAISESSINTKPIPSIDSQITLCVD